MKVKFLPQDISIQADPNKSVMELAKENQLMISSSCNGMCSCAECRVYVVEGEAHVLPPSQRETELIGGAYFVDNRRLSCQLFCFGDVTVDLSEQLERKSSKRQQFLSSKDSPNKKSSALGDILVQEDQEMSKVSAERRDSQNENPTRPARFYHQNRRKNQRRGHDKNPLTFKKRGKSQRHLGHLHHRKPAGRPKN